MVAAADEIFKQLPKLTTAQLQDLCARARMLMPAAPDDGVAADATLVHEALAAILTAAGHAAPPPPAVVAKGKSGPAFRAGAATLCAYVDTRLRPDSKVARVAAVRLLTRLLARRMAACGIPLGFKPLVQACNRVAAEVEAEFPGYQASGLLPIVLDPRRLAARGV